MNPSSPSNPTRAPGAVARTTPLPLGPAAGTQTGAAGQATEQTDQRFSQLEQRHEQAPPPPRAFSWLPLKKRPLEPCDDGSHGVDPTARRHAGPPPDHPVNEGKDLWMQTYRTWQTGASLTSDDESTRRMNILASLPLPQETRVLTLKAFGARTGLPYAACDDETRKALGTSRNILRNLIASVAPDHGLSAEFRDSSADDTSISNARPDTASSVVDSNRQTVLRPAAPVTLRTPHGRDPAMLSRVFEFLKLPQWTHAKDPTITKAVNQHFQLTLHQTMVHHLLAEVRIPSVGHYMAALRQRMNGDDIPLPHVPTDPSILPWVNALQAVGRFLSKPANRNSDNDQFDCPHIRARDGRKPGYTALRAVLAWAFHPLERYTPATGRPRKYISLQDAPVTQPLAGPDEVMPTRSGPA